MSAQPETVGRFRIGAPFRAGEGGRLFSATDLDTDRRVTLRLFARDSDDWRRAFMARTAQLTSLQHPHLARVLAGGTDATRAWWVYDHESVPTLAELLASGTAPPLDRRLSMLADVCRGAAYAWARGVTFLDLRPPWLWIAADGHCIVSGYRPPAIEGRELDTGMHHLDVLRYAPPEEVLGTPQDARSLVFTVGVVLYEVVTGQRLFDGDRLMDVALQVLHGKVPRLNVRPDGSATDATAAVMRVLSRALARAPDDRYATLTAFADDLEAIGRRMAGPPQTRAIDA
jgi:serine/threonine protein kinase